MFKEYLIESFQDEYDIIGSYSGHFDINKHDEVVTNYFLNKHKLKEKDLKNILNQVNDIQISILMNMEVELEFRNQGYGSQLLEHFFNESSSPILLICDTSETEWLKKWYESHDFDEIWNHHGFPIMYRDY